MKYGQKLSGENMRSIMNAYLPDSDAGLLRIAEFGEILI